jgi:hypothetical protein
MLPVSLVAPIPSFPLLPSLLSFPVFDPCTCLSRPVLQITPFEAVWTWVDLSIFAGTLLLTFREIL